MPQNKLSALLQAAQTGNVEAYNQFLNSCSVLLRGRLSRWIKRTEVREEIAQEVLIGIHRNLHTFLPDRSAEAWVIGIAKYKIADYYRKNPHQFEELSHDVTIQDESTNDLLDTLEELPSNLREALYMTKVEGLSTKAAAGKLGIKENAFRTRISRALAKLREDILT
ncbi:MAG: RNA polymerase sigma factor [Bacteriovoracaceae bacterium]|nr:RNA polymerase sigma factor [Bacteriovoracaceae bacterium]